MRFSSRVSNKNHQLQIGDSARRQRFLVAGQSNGEFYAHENKGNLLWRQSLDENEAHLAGDLGDEEIKDSALASNGKDFAYVRGSWQHDAILISGFK